MFCIFTSVSSVSAYPSVLLFSSFLLSSLGPPSPCVLSHLCNFPFVPLSISHSFLASLCPVDNFLYYLSSYPFYFTYYFLLRGLVFLSFSHSFLASLCPVDNFLYYLSSYPFYFTYYFLLRGLVFLSFSHSFAIFFF